MMNSDNEKYSVRPTALEDVDLIATVLTECAGEIPVQMDTSDRVLKLRERIEFACALGFSYVAINAGQVVGLLLASPGIKQGRLSRP